MSLTSYIINIYIQKIDRLHMIYLWPGWKWSISG